MTREKSVFSWKIQARPDRSRAWLTNDFIHSDRVPSRATAAFDEHNPLADYLSPHALELLPRNYDGVVFEPTADQA